MLPALMSEGGLRFYDQFNHVPILSREEEARLALDLVENQNRKAFDKLVKHNIRYVMKLAYRYKFYGIPLEDLIQEGVIGLMTAIRKFKPNKGRLITFADNFIRAEMFNFIRENIHLVRSIKTKNQIKLFFRYTKTLKQVGSDEGVSERLNIPIADIQAYKINNLPITSLESVREDWDLDIAIDHETPEGLYSIFEDGQQNQKTIEIINDTMKTMSLDDQQIIISRMMTPNKKKTLKEIGKDLGISAERVRQKELIILDKLTSSVKSI